MLVTSWLSLLTRKSSHKLSFCQANSNFSFRWLSLVYCSLGEEPSNLVVKMSTVKNSNKPEQSQPMSASWHWYPELPLKPVPYWLWPPQPIKVLGWLFQNFLQASDRFFYILLAFVVAFWWQPVGGDQAVLSLEWIAFALGRNLALLLIVAGGLHIWFYGIDGQGNVMKYDPRPMSKKKNKLFFLGYQTWDNMFYSLAFGAPIATAWEIFARWAYANGHVVTIDFFAHPIWFILLFPILTLYQALHFYLIHRALHWPPLYRIVHSVHHRNINPGPWSGISMHPIEHLLYFSSLAVFLILPSHPVHMIFLLFWQLLGAPSGHSGYEAVWAKDKARLLVGGFFHQMHHRYFECNYGNPELPIDKLFGTFHDGTEESLKSVRDRQRKMHGR